MLTMHADLLSHHGVFPLNKDQHYDKRYCQLSAHQPAKYGEIVSVEI